MSLSCYDDPSQLICEGFEIPLRNATLSVTNLCNAMDWMPGCTVRDACYEDSRLNATAEFCHPVSVLADICSRDMPRMRGCSSYGKLCKQGSRVRQCADHLPLPYIPTTKESLELVHSICDEMNHSGCELCVAGSAKPCDSLTVYSNLCVMMPSMHQCTKFHNICAASPTFPLCGSTAPGRLAPPTMKMFFHYGYSDYLLFEPLVPRTPLQYTFALIFLFVSALLYEALLRYQRRMESKWINLSHSATTSSQSPPAVTATHPNASTLLASDESTPLLNRPQWWNTKPAKPSTWTPLKIRMARAAFRLVGVTTAYALMLLVMTFNVGFFVAVVLGLTVGTFLFGPEPNVGGNAARVGQRSGNESGRIEVEEPSLECCG
ncbi:Ctr copper transporter family-domain-containing protein [Chytridium lagenaria]|nr:Ctr copper transporter family-domain-containing protein [Chytridium lagenaria]